MSRGPLNRVIGTLGLLALVPTAIMSATGHLTAADTAVRAGVTLALAIVVRKVTAWYLHATAASFERRMAQGTANTEASAAGRDSAETAEERRRRRSDEAAAAAAADAAVG